MKEYTVVRSYERGEVKDAELLERFEDGWEFLRASEYIPPDDFENFHRYGYIEYILWREKQIIDGFEVI